MLELHKLPLHDTLRNDHVENHFPRFIALNFKRM